MLLLYLPFCKDTIGGQIRSKQDSEDKTRKTNLRESATRRMLPFPRRLLVLVLVVATGTIVAPTLFAQLRDESQVIMEATLQQQQTTVKTMRNNPPLIRDVNSRKVGSNNNNVSTTGLSNLSSPLPGARLLLQPFRSPPSVLSVSDARATSSPSWSRTTPFTEPMVNEERLRAILLNESSKASDLIRLAPKYADVIASNFEEMRLVLQSLESERPAYDRVVRMSSFSHFPTAQGMVYPFTASTVKRSTGAGVILIRWEPFHQPRIWGKWVAHAVTDSDCHFVMLSNFIWTFFRAYRENTYSDIPSQVMNATAAMCYRIQASASLRTTEQNVTAAGGFEWLPTRREYFYCVHDYTAPGDQIVLTSSCMFRYFSRYPIVEERRNVSVLFVDAPEYPGLMNTIGMFQRHFPEVHFILLPKNRFFAIRDADLLAPSRVPHLFGNNFIKEIVWPRVHKMFANKLTPYRRIVLVSTGKSSTNRAYVLSAGFLEKMAKFGFVVLPPELPHDERMFHLHHADFLITSVGSASAVNNNLCPCSTSIPRLLLIHTGYRSAYSQCPKQNTTCKDGKTWVHRTSSIGDDLSLLDEDLLDAFLREFSTGPYVTFSPAKHNNTLRRSSL